MSITNVDDSTLDKDENIINNATNQKSNIYNLPYINYNPFNIITPLNYGYYNDLNKDKTVIKTVIKYFYYKIIDKWLYSDLLPLLGYITVVNGSPQLVKTLDDYKLPNESNKDLDDKIDFIENIILTKDMVKSVLKHIVQKYNIKWYLLYKNEDIIKKKIYKYIKEELEYAIKK
jgi:hypothetical protein